MALIAQKQGDRYLTIVEIFPIKSSSSLDTAERYARTLAGIVRTLRMSVKKCEGVNVCASSLGSRCSCCPQAGCAIVFKGRSTY
eukprot:11867278-Heterocapsa_arctica.AAC.1